MKNFNRAIQRHCKIFLIQVTKITNLHNKLKPNPHKSFTPKRILRSIQEAPRALATLFFALFRRISQLH